METIFKTTYKGFYLKNMPWFCLEGLCFLRIDYVKTLSYHLFKDRVL